MALPATTRGEHRRRTILQAAHDLFVLQGYHGTTMRQIALQAHVALGGLYNYFSSKEQVFEAVFLAFHPYHEVLPLIANAQGDSVEQLLQDAMRRMTRVVEEHPGFLNLMFVELVEFKSTHSQKLFNSLFPQGQQIVQRLTGSFPKQIRTMPELMVVRTFLGMFLGYYLTQAALEPGAPPEFKLDARQYFVDIYLHGIMANTEPDNPSHS